MRATFDNTDAPSQFFLMMKSHEQPTRFGEDANCGISGKRTPSAASSRMAFRSSSERDGIVLLLLRLQHTQLASLLDAVVQLVPEAVEILGGGNQRTDDDQPKQNRGQRVQRGMPRAGNQHGDGTNLQHHFRFAQCGGGNYKSFRGSDVAQAENREFAPDDDHHHPAGNQVHVHQGDKGGGNQQFVGDGVEENPQGGHLPITPRKVAVRPVRRRRRQQDQNAPNLEVHREPPQFHVGAAGQEDHDEYRNEKDPQYGEEVRQIHKSSAVEAKFAAFQTLGSL